MITRNLEPDVKNNTLPVFLLTFRNGQLGRSTHLMLMGLDLPLMNSL